MPGFAQTNTPGTAALPRWRRWLRLGAFEALARLRYRLARSRSDDVAATDYREWLRRFGNAGARLAAGPAQPGDYLLRIPGEPVPDWPGLPRLDLADLQRGAAAWPADFRRLLLLGPRRKLHADARAVLQQALRRPGVLLAYADEDALDRRGRHHSPRFKPGWDPELLLEEDYASGLALVARDALPASLARELPATGARLALLLRLARRLDAAQVVRVPCVLSHAEAGAEGGADTPAAAREAALRDWLADESAGSRARLHAAGAEARIAWDPPARLPRVSVIIPTRDQPGHLGRCLETLARTDYPDMQIVLVDNGSLEADALAILSRAREAGAVVLRRDEAFNFSRLVNAGVAASDGELLCLLNNDVELTDPAWLREMVALAARPATGVVGALLRFPAGGIQHAGILMGMHGAASNLQLVPPALGARAAGRQLLRRHYCAVTGACLLVSRAVFARAGGFDEDFEVRFNDVDFCMRVRALGLHVVWTPDAQLVHDESATRAHCQTGTGRELANSLSRLQQRWLPAMCDDPFYNPNLALDNEPYRVTLLQRSDLAHCRNAALAALASP